jgi:hypothetical protein
MKETEREKNYGFLSFKLRLKNPVDNLIKCKVVMLTFDYTCWPPTHSSILMALPSTNGNIALEFQPKYASSFCSFW